jgi:hypothetical protein
MLWLIQLTVQIGLQPPQQLAVWLRIVLNSHCTWWYMSQTEHVQLCSISAPPNSTLPNQHTEHNKISTRFLAAVLRFILPLISHKRSKHTQPDHKAPHMKWPAALWCVSPRKKKPLLNRFLLLPKLSVLLNAFVHFEKDTLQYCGCFSRRKHNYYCFIFPSLAD